MTKLQRIAEIFAQHSVEHWLAESFVVVVVHWHHPKYGWTTDTEYVNSFRHAREILGY